MKLTLRLLAFVFTVLVSQTLFAAENELFPFVISFDAPKNITNISAELDAPAGKHGFVRVEDGHFATDAGRIRFWGTNTCFAANFLDHDAVDRMADRLARFGINCVRLHHMDMRDIWGTGQIRSQMTLDPDQMEKLDYYIAALKKRGIYVNINLHVSRSLDERDGFPPNVDRPSHDKGIDNYYRPFIDANKKYARDLLTHVNQYTGNAYKDEPAVAMIEINNENSIVCMWGGWGGLDVIRDPFLADLRKHWNDWLKTKYADDATLQKAWKCRAVPLGDELVKHADFADGYVPNYDGWSWEIDAKNDAPLSNENGVLRMDVRKMGEVSWHPQLVGSGFGVERDRIYTLEIKAKANKNTTVNVGVRMNHEPWEGLGFESPMKLTEDWQTFRFTFLSTVDDADARISLGNFAAETVYEIDSVSFRPGGTVGLHEGQSLAAGTVPVIWKKEAGNYPKEAVDDFCDFLLDIEAKYWNEMYRFLKDDIQVRQPVSGTQLEYGGTHAQAKMDYCDIHSYWNHPGFPGRPWDLNNWYLYNRALVNHVDREILPRLASKRVYGMPFTVSEYNHPYPNQYAAEGLPLLAAFGAFQDWDGIFPFAYSHSNNPEPQMTTSFFDTSGNTAQMAHMIACSELFNAEFENVHEIVAPLTAEKERENFKRDHGPYGFGFSGLGLDQRVALNQRVAVDVSGKFIDMPKLKEIPKDAKMFGLGEGAPYFNMAVQGEGYADVTTDKASLFTGFIHKAASPAQAARYFLKRPDWQICFGPTNLDWATVSLSRVGEEKGGVKRYLLVATGEMRNTDMKIESVGEDRITVGSRFGKPPVLCEGIPAQILIKGVQPASIRYWSLDESGTRKTEFQGSRHDDSEAAIVLKPEFKTIWYELEITD